MIDISNVQVSGWEAAIRGMRNPMNSWDKSDTIYSPCDNKCDECDIYINCPFDWGDDTNGSKCSPMIGKNDMKLMKALVNGGTDHRKYLRMINVTMDITAPLYWWKEFDTYKVGTVANSCSTMHKIHAKEFDISDFSVEHLMELEEQDAPVIYGIETESGPDYPYSPMDIYEDIIIPMLNESRRLYLNSDGNKKKKYWWQMIQLLPTSYNQKRTVQLNYEVLAHIYFSDRRHHKLDEWRTFCNKICCLPYFVDIFYDQLKDVYDKEIGEIKENKDK